jgi:hypothetical protein
MWHFCGTNIYRHIFCLFSSLLPGIEKGLRYWVGRSEGGDVVADLSAVMLEVICLWSGLYIFQSNANYGLL